MLLLYRLYHSHLCGWSVSDTAKRARGVEDGWQRRHGSVGRKARLDCAGHTFVCLSVCSCTRLSLCRISIVVWRAFVPSAQPVTSNTRQLRHTSSSQHLLHYAACIQLHACTVHSATKIVTRGPNWTSVSGLRDLVCDTDSQRRRCTGTSIPRFNRKTERQPL